MIKSTSPATGYASGGKRHRFGGISLRCRLCISNVVVTGGCDVARGDHQDLFTRESRPGGCRLDRLGISGSVSKRPRASGVCGPASSWPWRCVASGGRQATTNGPISRAPWSERICRSFPGCGISSRSRSPTSSRRCAAAALMVACRPALPRRFRPAVSAVKPDRQAAFCEIFAEAIEPARALLEIIAEKEHAHEVTGSRRGGTRAAAGAALSRGPRRRDRRFPSPAILRAPRARARRPDGRPR